MSLHSRQTNITANDYFFILANISTLTANNITVDRVAANFISTGILDVGYISTPSLRVSSIYSDGKIEGNELSTINLYADIGVVSTLFTEHIILDQATIDVVNGNTLLLNGIPLATTQDLSTIQDWAAFPAVSTVFMNGNNLTNAGNITCQNINNALNVQTDTLTVLTSATAPSAVITNLRTTNFSTVNSVNSNVLSRNISSLTLQSQIGAFGGVSSLGISTGTINGIPFTAGSNWSQYPAIQTVSMNGNTLSGGSNFAITTSNLSITASNQFSNSCRDFSVVADEGANIASITNINLTAQNGTYGAVGITANGGFNNGINGVVNITANGAQLLGVGQGGSVNITANTPSGFSNLPSKITLNSSGINSYAGAIPPIASLAGYNFIYGTGGVNICAGLPSIFPNVPFTTFLYGTAGVTVGSDLYAPSIFPYWDGTITPPDLAISGRYITPNLAQVYVTLSNVKYLDMDFFAEIRQVKGITFCNSYSNNFLSNANTIQGTGSISGYATISGATLSGTNVNFTTASGPTVNTTNLTASNSVITTNLTASNSVSTVAVNASSLRGYSVQSILGNFSTLNASSIVSPVYGSEFRIINTLPGSSQGGSGPTSVSRLIAEKPSGISTIAQIVAADTGVTVAAFLKSGALTNLLLNASTITQPSNNTVIQGVRQPFIQFNTVATSGGSGSQQIQLPVSYVDSNYVVQATMRDADAAQMAAQVDSISSFTVYWANGGGGAHAISWTTLGNL